MPTWLTIVLAFLLVTSVLAGTVSLLRRFWPSLVRMTGPRLRSLWEFSKAKIKQAISDARSEKDPDSGQYNAKVKTWKYWGWLVLQFIAAPVFIDIFFRSRLGFMHIDFGDYHQKISVVDLVTVTLIESQLFTQWFMVPLGFYGGLTVLQHEALRLKKGPAFAPFGVEPHLAPLEEQTTRVPADPNQVLDVGEMKKAGLEVPMIIATGGPIDGDKDILNARGTFEPIVTIGWQGEERDFFNFYVNLPGRTWAQKEARIQLMMRQIIQGRLADEFRKRPPHKIIDEMPAIRRRVRASFVKAVKSWGITICTFEIANVDPNKGINTALDGIPIARAQGQQKVILAEAAKQETILDGEAKAQARKAGAEATEIEHQKQGEGRKAEALAMGMSPAEVRAYEVAEALAKQGTIVLGAETIFDPVKIGERVKEVLANAGKQPIEEKA